MIGTPDIMKLICRKFRRPELLHSPPIPRPMSGVNPRTIKGQAWWDKKRKEAYAKNNYHCWACGLHTSQFPVGYRLEAHEMYDINYLRGRMKLQEVVALCYCCHAFIHIHRTTQLYWKGQIDEIRYLTVMHHGYDVLRSVGLQPWWQTRALLEGYRPTGREHGVFHGVKWREWRLELGGKLYGPKYKTEMAWKRKYGVML